MMIERGIQVDHSTMIWVHQYSPEIEKEDKKTFKTNK
jgi:transposase-like protein